MDPERLRYAGGIDRKKTSRTIIRHELLCWRRTGVKVGGKQMGARTQKNEQKIFWKIKKGETNFGRWEQKLSAGVVIDKNSLMS